MNRKLIVVSAGLLIVLSFLQGVFFYSEQKNQKITHVVKDNREALLRPHSPVYGNPAAKVTIVEFFDPACESCKAFYPFVKTLVNANFGRVNLVLRYAPFHKGSADAVRVLEAAKKQNVYWPVLEAILAAQDVWASDHKPQPELIWDYLKETGIDIARAKADVNDPLIAKILKQDMADIATLKVTGTPTFFVNGKPLINFGRDQLKELVGKEVRLVYGN